MSLSPLLSLIQLSLDSLTINYLVLILALISVPTVYFLFFMDNVRDAPPSFAYIVPAIQGKFNLKQRGPLDLIKAGYEKHGDCFRLRILTKTMTVMIGPEANQLVFEAKDSVLSQKEIYSFTVPVFGPNIVYDAPRPVMQQQLKFTAKGLNTQHMERHAGKIVEEAEQFFAKWGNEGEVDLLDEFSKLIILTASRCLLGEEIRDNVHEEFAELYQTLSDGMSHISVFWPYAPTQAHKNRDIARSKIRDIFAPIIAKRRAESEVEAAQHDDFLQVLVDSRYTDGSHATDEEIVGLLIAALFGGQHTSNITSTWMGFHMIQNKPTLMPRLLAEQEEILNKYNGQLTFGALSEMELLNCTMKETLRMYPPLIILMRTAQENIQYKNFVIPKGDVVAVVPPVSHRIPSIYKDPEVWDPDRFYVRSEDKVKYSFISFGGGRHGCLGQQFAYLQVKSIWSTLLRQFDFELMPGFAMPPIDFSTIVAGPRPPCIVRYKRKSELFKVSSF